MIELQFESYSLTEIPTFVQVGKYSSIAAGVIFHSLEREHQYTINKKSVYTTSWDQPRETGTIIIGNDVWVGDGVRILPNTNIADGAIIGAGSVIKGIIPPFAVVVGNPGRVIKYRFLPKVREKLLRISWWNWDKDIINKNRELLKDIDKFLEKYDK